MKLLMRMPNHKRILSKRNYYIFLLGFWVYAIVWLAIHYYMYLVWQAPLYYKGLIEIVLLLVAPALSDLFCSYSSYLKETKQHDRYSITDEKRESVGS